MKFATVLVLHEQFGFSLLRGSGLKFYHHKTPQNKESVLPLTREWIEIIIFRNLTKMFNVLPLTREWIEIRQSRILFLLAQFSLLRGSGLKSVHNPITYSKCKVLPLTREWIEMSTSFRPDMPDRVLPLTREWIEMASQKLFYDFSPPFSLLRGSGLKSFVNALFVLG